VMLGCGGTELLLVSRYHRGELDEAGSARSDTAGGESRHSEHAEPRSSHHTRCKQSRRLQKSLTSWQGWGSGHNCPFSTIQNLELQLPILGEFRGKIEITSTRNLLCWKFAAVCGQIAMAVICCCNCTVWNVQFIC